MLEITCLSKNVLKHIWNYFNTKFPPYWKDSKSSYQEKQVLALSCNLIALVLDSNILKDLRVSKIVEEIIRKGSGAR